jgi:transposase-like protein
MIAGFAQASPQTEQHLDEVYLKSDGRMVYLWRAVDSEGACHAESAVLGASIGE